MLRIFCRERPAALTETPQVAITVAAVPASPTKCLRLMPFIARIFIPCCRKRNIFGKKFSLIS